MIRTHQTPTWPASAPGRPSKMERFAPPRPVLRLREILVGVGIVVVMTVADII